MKRVPLFALVFACGVMPMYGLQALGAPDVQSQSLFLVRDVQSALGLSSKGPDLLALAMPPVNHEMKLIGAAAPATLDTFATNIVKDGDLTVMLGAVAGHATISAPWSFQKDAGWKYGKFSDLLTISSLLHERAKYLKSQNPRQSQVDARAALLIDAANEWGFDSILVAGLMRQPEFVKLAGLSPEQEKEINNAVKVVSDQAGKNWGERFHVACKEHDAIATSTGPVDVKALNNCLTWINDARKSAAGMYWHKYDLALFTRDLLDAAYLRKDTAAIKRVTDFINAWKSDEKNVNAKRWLDEALKIRSTNIPMRSLYDNK